MSEDAGKPAPTYHPHWWNYARMGDGNGFWASPNRRIQFWLAACFCLHGVLYALFLMEFLGASWLLAAALILSALLFVGVVAPPRARLGRALLLGLAASAILLPVSAVLIILVSTPFMP